MCWLTNVYWNTKVKETEEKVEFLQASLRTQSSAISALHQILINQHTAIERLELRLSAAENAPPVYKPRTE